MTRRLIAALFCLLSLPALAFAQHEAHGAMPPDLIGSTSVKFETSCAPPLRDDFNKGVALLHSFWFPEGLKTFNEVLKRDPSCAIAYWAIGVNRLLNPFGGQTAEATALQGQEAIDKGLAMGAKT
jgi:hypothetical protein